MRPDGRTAFNLIQNAGSGGAALVFFLFDLLFLMARISTASSFGSSDKSANLKPDSPGYAPVRFIGVRQVAIAPRNRYDVCAAVRDAEHVCDNLAAKAATKTIPSGTLLPGSPLLLIRCKRRLASVP
jgi:hypothetical protein